MAKRPVPKYDFKAFGAAIKAARTGRKESRKKVSDEMFISPRYLANIENKGQHPSLQIFFQLMLRYNISVDQFLLETLLEKNTQRRQLDALLDGMSDTAKLYEDYALGKAGADEIDLLLPKYRKEQGELKAQLALFHEESNEQKETVQNAEKWVALIRQYNDLQELTAGIIRELITKIYVGDVRKVDGEKVQSIEIHYRFIGSLPDGAGK